MTGIISGKHGIIHGGIQAVSVVCSQLGSIYLLDHAVNRTSDFRVSCGILKFRDFCLFAFLIVFIFFQVHPVCFNFYCIGKLGVLGRFLFFFFQGGYLFCQTGRFIFQSVQFQLAFCQIFLDTAQVILKQELALLYRFPGFHLDFFYGSSALKLYLHRLLRLHDSGISVCHAGNVAGDLTHLRYISRGSAVAAAAEHSQFPAYACRSPRDYNYSQKD